jgi:hypothetical protein
MSGTDLATILAAIGAVTAAQAAVLAAVNLRRYRPMRVASEAGSEASRPLVSVCIPARNEEPNIEACVRSLLASRGARLEVLCYDDQSSDRTPAILARLAAEDPRVRLPRTVPLPAGWNGKQHACQRLADAAHGDWLLFTDADVRFEPDCVASAVAEAESGSIDLLSTFPRQVTGSLGEALLVPLIHFLLLSYLPIGRMRSTLDPAASAGCGQFLLARAAAYRASGGHARFPDSMHDGIRMPRSFRAAGFRTDLLDGSRLVSCRMYRGFAATWRGFAKNAFEGLGSVGLLALITVLHLVGHVLPWAIVLGGLLGQCSPAATALAGIAIVLAVAERALLSRRFAQGWTTVLLHPLGILTMTVLQWWSWALALTGRRSWKGRSGTACPIEPSTPEGEATSRPC